MMKKLWILLLLVMLSMSMIVMSACAETVLKDGIEVMLTTDKENYDSLDVIDAKLTVKNTNSFGVENVSMEIKAPEGYMLTSEGETKIGELSAGETQQQQTGMRDTEAPVPVLPKTGDNSHGMLWGLLFVLSSAAVCVLVIRYPQAKRIISLLLCVALIAPYMLEVAPVLAENLGNGELEDTITVTKKVTVDGELVEISGSVRYNASSIISGNTKVKVSLLTLDEQSEGTSWFTTSQINTSANKPFTIEWNSIEGVTLYSFTILNEKREPAFSNQKTWFAGESTNRRTLILTGPGVYYLRSYAFTKETEDAGFRGDYTNAPYSEIKIIVSEESTSDFVLSASEENKKILFSTDYQESEVKLYQSGQISVAHSEITNGVLLMDEYNVMEGDPFQYLYQPLWSNKSYVFCAVANDGSVSNAILVAGADVCEELPTVNGVVMSRNSLQKGDTISINGGIVSGNDLRIYDIEAYLQKEDSGEKIWPAVWWYYYVWGQHGDLSSFELNSFEEFTLISDEEPGRYRFYVDVKCYGNVLVTLPTSVFVDVQISAEDCDHSSGNHNTTKNSDSVTRYRLNPEDESSHPNGHQTGDIYTRYCADCGSFLAGDILIWSNALQSHQMVDGACSLCGYIAEETECQHTEYTDVYNSNIEIKYTDNKDGKTHIWQNGFDRICNACQMKFDVVYGAENTEDHDYTNGDVCPCGYDRSNCQHTPGETKTYNRHVFAPFDEKQHQTTAIIWDVVCSSCGVSYEVTDTEGDEKNPVGLKYDHVWDETGKCETQGCEYQCAHAFEDIMLPDGNHKAENGIWESKGESGHWCTSIEWWEKCINCGLEQKYTQNDPYNGEMQPHKKHTTTATSYRYYDEYEHQMYTTETTYCGGCDWKKVEEKPADYRAAHVYENGVCLADGCGAIWKIEEENDSIIVNEKLNVSDEIDADRKRYLLMHDVAKLREAVTDSEVFDKDNISKVVYLNAMTDVNAADYDAETLAYVLSYTTFGVERIDGDNRAYAAVGHSAVMLIDKNGNACFASFAGQFNDTGEDALFIRYLNAEEVDEFLYGSKAGHLPTYEANYNEKTGTVGIKEKGKGIVQGVTAGSGRAIYEGSVYNRAAMKEISASSGATMYTRLLEKFNNPGGYDFLTNNCDYFALYVIYGKAARLRGFTNPVAIEFTPDFTPNSSYETFERDNEYDTFDLTDDTKY